jgi:hypothetical protein
MSPIFMTVRSIPVLYRSRPSKNRLYRFSDVMSDIVRQHKFTARFAFRQSSFNCRKAERRRWADSAIADPSALHPSFPSAAVGDLADREPESLPVRDAFGRNWVLWAAGVDASDPEQLAPRAELAAVISR